MKARLWMHPPEHPDIVIRPSGVWNTRRPLAVFLALYRERLRRLNVLSLARCRLLAELQLCECASPQPSARDFFKLSEIKRKHRSLSHEVGLSWSSYTHQLYDKIPNEPFDPTLSEVQRDLSLALYDVRLSAIVQIVSAFEAFAQAWSLNYLLARLEKDAEWTPAERELAVLLSPVHRFTLAQQQRRRDVKLHPVSKAPNMIPDWFAILRTFPEVDRALSNEPHIDFDIKSNKEITRPVTASLNAKVTLKFWRDFRNLVVHRSRRITTEFVRRHRSLYSEITENQKWKVPDLYPGHQIYLHFEMPRVMGFTHRAACEIMDDLLYRLSEGTRGSGERRVHWYAGLDPQATSGDLLLKEGDHELSLKWAQSRDFQQQFFGGNRSPRGTHPRGDVGGVSSSRQELLGK